MPDDMKYIEYELLTLYKKFDRYMMSHVLAYNNKECYSYGIRSLLSRANDIHDVYKKTFDHMSDNPCLFKCGDFHHIIEFMDLMGEIYIMRELPLINDYNNIVKSFDHLLAEYKKR